MFQPSPEQLALPDNARANWRNSTLRPRRPRSTARAIPLGEQALLRDAGFMTMTLPKEMARLGLSYFDAVLVIEEIGKACAAMGRITVDAAMGCIGAIRKYGTNEQFELAAELLRSGDKPALCITEPLTGSAATSMTTRADRRGDHYVPSARKWRAPSLA